MQHSINESNNLINQKIEDATANIAEKSFEPKQLAPIENDNRTFDDKGMYQNDAFLEPVTDFGIPHERYEPIEASNQSLSNARQKTTDTTTHEIKPKNTNIEPTNNIATIKSDVIKSKSDNDNAKQIENIITNTKVADDPLVLLQCPKAEMTGEWSFEKWEYWLRQAELIPAVLNLAHKGVMTGIIAQESVLLIPKSKAMEQMADEFFDRLVDRLKQDWPDIQVSYQLTDNTMNTPEQQMVVRKEQALAAAKVKVAQEPLAQELLKNYGGELCEVKLTV